MRLSGESHFASTLLRVIEGIDLKEGFLSQLCGILRLRFVQELVLGLSVAQSPKYSTHIEGVRFLHDKLNEDITSNLDAMPESLVQRLILFLKTTEGFAKERTTVFREIKEYAKARSLPKLLSLLSDGDGRLSLRSFAEYGESRSQIHALTERIGYGCHIRLVSELMEDIGYSCCQTRSNIKDIIKQFNGVTGNDVAKIIAMMTRTRIGLEDLGISFSGNGKHDSTTTWKIDLFADTINEMYPGFDWPAVFRALVELPEFEVSDQKEFMMLMSFYAMATDLPFPVSAVLGKLWPNTRGQLAFLRHAVSMPPDVLCLGSLAEADGLGVAKGPGSLAHHWTSPQLVRLLLELAELEDYDLVVQMFRYPLENCPVELLKSLMSVEPTWGSLHAELSSALISMFLTDPAQPGAVEALREIWGGNQQLVIRTMVEVYFEKQKDPTYLSRLLDLAQELKALTVILGAQPFMFSIDLAALAGRREHLNLEKWLQDRIQEHRFPFVKACVAFLNQRLKGENQYPSMGLSESIVATFEKCLRENLAMMPPELVKEVQLLTSPGQGGLPDDYLSSHPSQSPHAAPPDMFGAGGLLGGPSTLGEDTAFPKEIEDTTNAIFQSLYGGQVSVEEVVALLKKLKATPASEDKREQRIFQCMIHNLFDEYRFFPKYPHKYLRVTAVLFGSLIQHQLISYIPLGIALRYVLEALKQPPSSKMFKFGVTALDQFKYRLSEWPQYCAHIMQIPHMQQYHPAIIEHIEGLYGSAEGASPAELPAAAEAELPPWRLEAGEEGAAEGQGRLFSAGGSGGEGGESVPSLDALLQAGLPVPEVDEKTRDSLFFVCNNLALSNLEAKVGELQAFLLPEHHPYLAQYIVTKRVTSEPTYHDVYVGLLEALGEAGLHQLVLQYTYDAICVLLRSENAVSRPQDRGALKNLGSWLGKLTLARNKPVLHKDLPLKLVVLDGFDQGRLMAVVPFVAKVLESAASSLVFAPPNVWTTAMLRLLCEIYYLGDLKLNLKFEIELLCKNLGVTLQDLTPTALLKDRKPRGSVRPGKGGTEGSGPFISTLWAKCQVPNSPLFKREASLQRCIPVAIDRAIKEIISPVAERSATIASITARELVLKDMAMEGNEQVLQRAAHTMVRSLAGSLALVTCRDTLRSSIVNHLRGLLSAAAPAASGLAGLSTSPSSTLPGASTGVGGAGEAVAGLVEHAVQSVTMENLDLACALVERHTVEMAVKETDQLLTPDYEARRKHRELHPDTPFADAKFLQGRYPSFLPERLRPAAGGLQPHQQHVYDSFLDAVALPEPKREGLGEEEGTGVALEKLQQFVLDLDQAIAATGPTGGGNTELQRKLLQLPHVITQYVVSEEVAFAFAKTLFMALYERADLREYNVSVYIAILARIRDVVPAVQQHLTSWIKYTDIERRGYHSITVALVSAQLLNVSEFDAYLCTRLEGGRNAPCVEFVLYLLKRCVLEERTVAPADLGHTVGVLHRLYQQEGAGELQAGLGEVLARILALGYDPSSGLADKEGVALPPLDQENHMKEVADLTREWARLISSQAEAACGAFLVRLQESISHDPADAGDAELLSVHRVFLLGARLAYRDVLALLKDKEDATAFAPMDALAKLASGLFTLALAEAPEGKEDESLPSRVVQMVLSGVCQAVQTEHDSVAALLGDKPGATSSFNQRPFFRMLAALLSDLCASCDSQEDLLMAQVLSHYAAALATLAPARLPGFAFAWLSLVGNRGFMPKLLLLKTNRGWAPFQRLLLLLLQFLEPFLRQAELTEAVRLLYKGTLRVLLVLLHDFPEFLSDYHFSLCDLIPPSCIQMRNLVLSAFPRTMRLPDPFTPNLKVDLLPEINQSPHILSDYTRGIGAFKADVDAFLKRGAPPAFLAELRSFLALPPAEANKRGTRYNVPILNSLVLYVGTQAIAQLQASAKAANISQSAPMDIFQHLIVDLDSEGRYLFLNAIANQLRYPNNHTHYFSCVLLYLFAEANQANQKNVQEQITRVLLERLIVHRPHPWGLLITFIELIKNPRYSFWSHSFTRCSPEIERIFESVARIAIKG